MKYRSMIISFLLWLGVTVQSETIPRGTPQVHQTMFETQDYVISTHNALDYGVTPDDLSDDTAALQKAIDACYDDDGGVLFIPAGKYIFKDRLHIKSGVVLRGEWRNPEEHSDVPIGTLFCVYYGKREPEGDPFLLLSRSAGIKDLAIWYPEQRVEKPLPYAWTIKQDEGLVASLENITVYNAWQGLRHGPEQHQFLTVNNLFMTALSVGIMRDESYDVPRLQRVHLSPKYWIQSGLPHSPASQTEQRQLKDFLLQESIGAVIGHYEWTFMYDWLIEGFHTGILTRPSVNPAVYPFGPHGTWTNVRLIDNLIGVELGKNNDNGWGMTNVEISSNVKDAIGIKTAPSFPSICQLANVTFRGTFKHCILSRGKAGRITVTGSVFESWSPVSTAVQVEAGTVSIIKSRFEQQGSHVFLGAGTASACFLGNTFKGPPGISNCAPSKVDVQIDHAALNIKRCEISDFEFPEAIYKPENDTLYNVRDFGAVGNGKDDDSQAFQVALDTAQKMGGGTVYIPAGQYVLKTGLVLPEKIELRGVFDMTHHTQDSRNRGIKGSELWAYPGKGDEQAAAFIKLKAGSSLRGVTIYYPEQKWSDYEKNGAFTKFPWTLQSLGKKVRVKDVVLVNAYRGADFGTYESTGHRIDFLCGTALKTGLYVDNCLGKGYVKNVHWNPSFWAWSPYPDRPRKCITLRDCLITTLTGFRYGYTAEEHVLSTFVFGSKIGAEFVSNPQYGGANGIFIAHGTDVCENALRFKDIGQNARFVGLQLTSMHSDQRKHYLKIEDTVKGQAEFYNLLMWGFNPGPYTGIEMKSGSFYFLQCSFRTFGTEYGFHQTGGKLMVVAPHFTPTLNEDTKNGYHQGLYGYFGENIEVAEIIGALKNGDVSDAEVFINKAGRRLNIKHSIHH